MTAGDHRPCDPLTWTCHVCGDERPDELIAVFKRRLPFRFEAWENIRYCTDRPACVEGAKTKSLFTR